MTIGSHATIMQSEIVIQFVKLFKRSEQNINLSFILTISTKSEQFFITKELNPCIAPEAVFNVVKRQNCEYNIEPLSS